MDSVANILTCRDGFVHDFPRGDVSVKVSIMELGFSMHDTEIIKMPSTTVMLIKMMKMLRYTWDVLAEPAAVPAWDDAALSENFDDAFSSASANEACNLLHFSSVWPSQKQPHSIAVCEDKKKPFLFLLKADHNRSKLFKMQQQEHL